MCVMQTQQTRAMELDSSRKKTLLYSNMDVYVRYADLDSSRKMCVMQTSNKYFKPWGYARAVKRLLMMLFNNTVRCMRYVDLRQPYKDFFAVGIRILSFNRYSDTKQVQILNGYCLLSE